MLTEAEGGEGTAAGPCTYRLAVQALQVDDEGLVVILAPGDLGERRGSLAQQVVLRELEDRNGTIVRPTPLAETIAPHLSAQGRQEALHGIPREPSLHFFYGLHAPCPAAWGGSGPGPCPLCKVRAARRGAAATHGCVLETARGAGSIFGT